MRRGCHLTEGSPFFLWECNVSMWQCGRNDLPAVDDLNAIIVTTVVSDHSIYGQSDVTQFHTPGLRETSRVLDRHIVFERVWIDLMQALREARVLTEFDRVRNREGSGESGGMRNRIDDEGLAFPMSNRIARRCRPQIIFGRMPPSVCIDVPHSAVGGEDQGLLRCDD